jgi:hypothetical protein
MNFDFPLQLSIPLIVLGGFLIGTIPALNKKGAILHPYGNLYKRTHPTRFFWTLVIHAIFGVGLITMGIYSIIY